MVPQNIQAIVLAAGKSTRFNTGKSKLLETICGQAMILYPTKLLHRLGLETTLVVGYQKDAVKETVTNVLNDTVTFITQEEQRGTGHAIACTQEQWHKDHILIMNGDMPLVDKKLLDELYEKHIKTDAAISFVIAHNSDPRLGYGRVITADDKIAIVEAAHFKGDTQEHGFVNAGVYLAKRSFLQECINLIEQNPEKKEFYITDLVHIASNRNLTVSTVNAPFDIVRGVNTMQELWAAEHIKRAELVRHWMKHGVRFSAPQSVHIDWQVTIGAGTRIGAGVHLLQGSHIGMNCTIKEFTIIRNSTIADNVTINSHCVIKESAIDSWCTVGPFAHLRNQAELREEVEIGNFVEVKQSTIGTQTKAKHLAYLGNAEIGKKVNIGAGTITCNHNGVIKQETTIKDNAYIGSNNTLVAPITIEEHAFTAAGSVITENVPAQALAIGRARQINKEGYAKKLREQNNLTKNLNNPSDEGLSFMGACKTENDMSSTDN